MKPKELGPLVRVELSRDDSRRRVAVQCAESMAEAASNERVVVGRARGRYQRCGAPAKHDHTGIDARPWIERAAREPAGQGALVERTPNDAADGARPWKRTLERNSPLDDQVRPNKLCARIIEQPVQQVIRAAERQVRDDPEWLRRQRHRDGVCLEQLDIRPAAAEASGQTAIQLDRNDMTRNSCELVRQSPGARTKVYDEIVRAHAGIADQLRRQRAGAKEVLATRRRRPCALSAPTRHGPAPSSFRNPLRARY